MSETIPADVRLAAERVYDALGRGSSADTDRIARAIMEATKAERERCAEKADKWSDDLDAFANKDCRDLMRNFAVALRGTLDAR